MRTIYTAILHIDIEGAGRLLSLRATTLEGLARQVLACQQNSLFDLLDPAAKLPVLRGLTGRLIAHTPKEKH